MQFTFMEKNILEKIFAFCKNIPHICLMILIFANTSAHAKYFPTPTHIKYFPTLLLIQNTFLYSHSYKIHSVSHSYKNTHSY